MNQTAPDEAATGKSHSPVRVRKRGIRRCSAVELLIALVLLIAVIYRPALHRSSYCKARRNVFHCPGIGTTDPEESRPILRQQNRQATNMNSHQNTGNRPAACFLGHRLPHPRTKKTAWMLPLILLLCGISARADDGSQSPLDLKQVAPQPAPPTLDEPWKFTIGAPGFLAGIYGDVGIGNHSVYVSQSIGDLLPYVKNVTSFEASVQKGNFGFTASNLYMGLIADEGGNGLVKNINAGVNMDLADFGFSYRVLEGPHGWLDVLAGCRYTNLYQRATLYPNTGRINDASQNLVFGLSDLFRDKLSKIDIGGDIKDLVDQDIKNHVDKLVANSNLPDGPIAGRIYDQIGGAIRQIVEKLDPGLLAAIKAAAVAATDKEKAAAQQKVKYLQNQLTSAIASRVYSLLNQQVSKNNYWFDPYVGLRGKLNLNKAFYLIGSADIGGFDVGSQYTWEGYGALGCQVTRYIHTEVGYRCLYMDYRGGGLLFDTYLRGVQISTGITF